MLTGDPACRVLSTVLACHRPSENVLFRTHSWGFLCTLVRLTNLGKPRLFTVSPEPSGCVKRKWFWLPLVSTLLQWERNQARLQMQITGGAGWGVGGWTVTQREHMEWGEFLLNWPSKILPEGRPDNQGIKMLVCSVMSIQGRGFSLHCLSRVLAKTRFFRDRPGSPSLRPSWEDILRGAWLKFDQGASLCQMELRCFHGRLQGPPYSGPTYLPNFTPCSTCAAIFLKD